MTRRGCRHRVEALSHTPVHRGGVSFVGGRGGVVSSVTLSYYEGPWTLREDLGVTFQDIEIDTDQRVGVHRERERES